MEAGRNKIGYAYSKTKCRKPNWITGNPINLDKNGFLSPDELTMVNKRKLLFYKSWGGCPSSAAYALQWPSHGYEFMTAITRRGWSLVISNKSASSNKIKWTVWNCVLATGSTSVLRKETFVLLKLILIENATSLKSTDNYWIDKSLMDSN